MQVEEVQTEEVHALMRAVGLSMLPPHQQQAVLGHPVGQKQQAPSLATFDGGQIARCVRAYGLAACLPHSQVLEG